MNGLHTYIADGEEEQDRHTCSGGMDGRREKIPAAAVHEMWGRRRRAQEEKVKSCQWLGGPGPPD